MGLVGEGDDAGRLAMAACPQHGTDVRAMAIVPGDLDEDAAQVRIAHLGDPAVADGLPGAVLAGDHAQEAHQAARGEKAADVKELGDNDQRGQGVDAAETPEPPDGRAIRLPGRQCGHLGIEFPDAGLELLDGESGIIEDDSIGGGGERQ